VRDAGGGHERQHPVEEAHPRPQDRGEDELLAGDLGACIVVIGVSISTVSIGRSRVTS
jgi:hypothetical protein